VERAGFNNLDRDWFDEVVEAYDLLVGGPRYTSHREIASGSLLHELDVQNTAHLAESVLGELVDQVSADKRVPLAVWARGPAFKRAFLQSLFEGDGSCSRLPRGAVQVSYSTRSEQLSKDVQQLLLELGVVSRRSRSARGEWKVYLGNARDVRLFSDRVGFWGRKQTKLRALVARPVSGTALSSDHVPFIADYLRAAGARSKADLEDAGVQPVFSIRVDSEDHAFLSDGFVSHNTECRLAPLAMEMLREIDQETVDFNPNYDGRSQEPTILPSRIPNLLVNGSSGIAVGMATNIPPHNLREVASGVQWVLDHPDASPEEALDALLARVQGPDFPTGGLIVGRSGIEEAYRTGRGSVR
jgi:DNA gyrase subunit A